MLFRYLVLVLPLSACHNYEGPDEYQGAGVVYPQYPSYGNTEEDWEQSYIDLRTNRNNSRITDAYNYTYRNADRTRRFVNDSRYRKQRQEIALNRLKRREIRDTFRDTYDSLNYVRKMQRLWKHKR